MILTPVEVQTCNMIKNGLSTKEIAKLRGISPATVSRHREHIRKKLGITNKKVNLATYLNVLMAE
jgi:DNA-binding CsgD family transcriptional regulator